MFFILERGCIDQNDTCNFALKVRLFPKTLRKRPKSQETRRDFSSFRDFFEARAFHECKNHQHRPIFVYVNVSIFVAILVCRRQFFIIMGGGGSLLTRHWWFSRTKNFLLHKSVLKNCCNSPPPHVISPLKSATDTVKVKRLTDKVFED